MHQLFPERIVEDGYKAGDTTTDRKARRTLARKAPVSASGNILTYSSLYNFEAVLTRESAPR
jgi:hypothetical protein